MKVLFLLNNAFGIGGTIRTTFNLADALVARGHDVEILSTARHLDEPQLPLDPAVRLMSLVESRTGHPDYDQDAVGRGVPPKVYPAADYRAVDYDRYVEDRYRRTLPGMDADVVIATRPGLIVYATTFAPRHMARVGQEHLVRGQHRRALRRAMPWHLRKLDAFVTVSARDAEDYRTRLPRLLQPRRLLHIPNSIPRPRIPPSDGRAKLVVAAGRLVKTKRYDVLLRAFAKVVAERPDWQLRIYGSGDQDAELRALLLELRLHNHVRMMGSCSPLDPEWAKASIAVSSAAREPFGMTLVEAMRCGLPVISTDAPHGPGEILRHGEDGLLTPVNDHDALADALLRVINDEGLRRSMAAAALRNSERYDPAPIAERYEELLTDVTRRRRRRRRPRGRQVRLLGPAPLSAQPVLDWDGLAPLPAGMSWEPTGRQVFRLVTADGTPVRAGLRDTRAFRDGPIGNRIELPFRRPDGILGMRLWDQPVYAEVGDVDPAAEGVMLTGRLHGAGFGAGAALQARSEGRNHDLPLHTEGATFRTTVDALAPGTWALWLRPAAGAKDVRLGRFRDDIVHKNIAFVLPAVTVDGATLQPAYTSANDFIVVATT